MTNENNSVLLALKNGRLGSALNQAHSENFGDPANMLSDIKVEMSQDAAVNAHGKELDRQRLALERDTLLHELYAEIPGIDAIKTHWDTAVTFDGELTFTGGPKGEEKVLDVVGYDLVWGYSRNLMADALANGKIKDVTEWFLDPNKFGVEGVFPITLYQATKENGVKISPELEKLGIGVDQVFSAEVLVAAMEKNIPSVK